jgi:OpgC protein
VSASSGGDGSAKQAAEKPGGRDLRLDLFRGLANWAIFLDHIPDNLVNWITTRNYGFSDAADIFVFISGYTAAFVYAKPMRRDGFLSASARILKRAWQIYLAHVFLFVIYLAEIAYLAAKSRNPSFVEEFNLLGFLRDPDTVLIEGLILKFKPVNMDVLPLYIVLMLAFPLILWSLLRRPNLTLLASAVLYGLARWFGWNLPAFPTGEWYFNPFAWQLLFVFAAWCGIGAFEQVAWLLHSRAVLWLAISYLLFALVMTLAGSLPWLHALVPSARPRRQPDRQDQPRPAPVPALRRARARHGAFRASRLGRPCLAGVPSGDPERAAFARSVLLRHLSVVRRPLRAGRDFQRGVDADPRKRGRHRADDGARLSAYLVSAARQAHGGGRRSRAGKAGRLRQPRLNCSLPRSISC